MDYGPAYVTTNTIAKFSRILMGISKMCSGKQSVNVIHAQDPHFNF